MKTIALAISLIVASSVVAPAAVHDPEASTPGALHARSGEDGLVEMPLQHTDVHVEITAFVARTTVEQVFVNPFEEPVEAVYTFPLGHDAAVDDFELAVGDRVIVGEIHRRDEAREIYQSARAAGYQAALLEQERPNIFTQNVANLEPGREIRVRIRTVETVPYEAGTYRFTFPLVVGPRYIPGGSSARMKPQVTRPARASTARPTWSVATSGRVGVRSSFAAGSAAATGSSESMWSCRSGKKPMHRSPPSGLAAGSRS